jgi:hypothetical protein
MAFSVEPSRLVAVAVLRSITAAARLLVVLEMSSLAITWAIFVILLKCGCKISIKTKSERMSLRKGTDKATNDSGGR